MDDREDGAFFLDSLADSSDEGSALADDSSHGFGPATESALLKNNTALIKDLEQLDATVAAPEQALQALAFLEFQKKAAASHAHDDQLLADELPSDSHAFLLKVIDNTSVADLACAPVDAIDELDSTVVVHDDDQFTDDEFDATVVCDVEAGLLVGEQSLSNTELSDFDATALLETLPESSGFLQEFDALAPPPPVIRQVAPLAGSRSAASAGAHTGVWLETPPLRQRGRRGSVYFVLALVVFLGAYFYAERIRAFFSAAAPTMPMIVDATDSAAPVAASQQMDEIRYCITQGIRLSSAADNVAGLSRAAVSRLQNMFEAYDKRCASSDFDPVVYVATYRSVDAERARFEQQGVALLSADLLDEVPAVELNNPVLPVTLKLLGTQDPVEVVAVDLSAGDVDDIASAEKNAADVPPIGGVVSAVQSGADASVFSSIFSDTESSHRTVKDIQWRLFKLGFYNGRFDGVFADNTRQALLAFFRDGKISPAARDLTSFSEREIFQLVDSAYASL